MKTFKVIFTKKDGTQRIATVQAQSLEEAIEMFLRQRAQDENMNTPVEQ